MGYNNFNGSDLVPFFSHLNELDKLKYIDISWNNLGSSADFINTLFSALADNKSI